MDTIVNNIHKHSKNVHPDVEIEIIFLLLDSRHAVVFICFLTELVKISREIIVACIYHYKNKENKLY